MTQDPSQPPEDRPPHGSRPAPDATSAPRTDLWELDRWRAPVVGALLGVLTLPAVAMALVGLLVLAVQGVATWLVVTAVALVTTLLGGYGATVAARGGHRGVVHRLGLLAWVWGVLVVVLAVVLALSLDSSERVAVAVLLVLGGTYTVVLGLGLWAASRVLPAPAGRPGGSEGVDGGPATPSGASPTVSEVPTPTPAPDDDEVLADWPEWGGAEREPDAGPRRDAEDVVDVEVVEVVEVVDPAPVGRRTPAMPARPAARPDVEPEPARPPQRRSVTSGGTTPRRTTSTGDPSATERITRQTGDDGPPTQRLPPLDP
ncbi:hypothetical protein H9657_16945 [Cellulomonas sp. Sa3CUA2]|uniref:Uncharacterized protein n=1 Tax=Cellulomonas avistercoris TaxID=2762242 RepID=A0ABR8QHS2_9CELL|nr:hypothetical protein [Cellulomonas avistercoris]MBD7919961.1 hypothetical protein [Cellulomonas avistercoris]